MKQDRLISEGLEKGDWPIYFRTFFVWWLIAWDMRKAEKRDKRD